MKLGSVTVLTLSLAFGGSGAFSSLAAQDASVASATDVNQCVKWMKATVSARVPDPTEFCSGIWDGHFGGWYSAFKCGQPEQQPTGTPDRYCASSGQITARGAWAAGFRSTSTDGHELLDETSAATRGSQQPAATFYSRTAVWMGNLRLPAGMYDLIPVKSPEGWQLEVAQWANVPSPEKYLGSVEMKGATLDNLTRKNYLEISMWPWAGRCSNPSPYLKFWELHFIYGSTDLFVCVRPEQPTLDPQENISERR